MSFADAKVPRMQGSPHSLRLGVSRVRAVACLPQPTGNRRKLFRLQGSEGMSGSAARTPKLPEEIKKIAKKGNDRKDAPKDPVRFICQG